MILHEEFNVLIVFLLKLVASSKPSPYRTSMAPPPGRIYSHNSTPSRPGSIGSLSQGGTIQIHIDDHPAVASAAHKPSNSLDDAFLKPQSDGLPIAGQPHGPVVRLFATGSAGVQLLDLAKTIAQAGSGATIRNLDANGAVDGMDLDVFESRPNLQGNNSDSDRESSKRSDSSKTLGTYHLVMSYFVNLTHRFLTIRSF